MFIPQRILRYLKSLPDKTFTPIPFHSALCSRALENNIITLFAGLTRIICLNGLKELPKGHKAIIILPGSSCLLFAQFAERHSGLKCSVIYSNEALSKYSFGSDAVAILSAELLCHLTKDQLQHCNLLVISDIGILLEQGSWTIDGLSDFKQHIKPETRVILGLELDVQQCLCLDETKLLLDKLIGIFHYEYDASSSLVSAEALLNSYRQSLVLVTSEPIFLQSSLFSAANYFIDNALDFFKNMSDFVNRICQRVLHTLGPVALMKLVYILLDQLENEIQDIKELNMKLLVCFSSCLRQMSTMFDRVYNTSVNSLEDYLELFDPKIKKLADILAAFCPTDDYVITPADEITSAGIPELNDSFSDSDFSDEESTEANNISRQIKAMSFTESVAAPKYRTPFNGIVFVKDALSAVLLHLLIEEIGAWDDRIYFVRSQYLNMPSDNESKRHEVVFKQFRNHQVNLLFIPIEDEPELPLNLDCNLVVCYAPVLSFKQFVYTRRLAKNGDYIVLSDDKDPENPVSDLMEKFYELEDFLSEKCIGSELSQLERLCNNTDILPDLSAVTNISIRPRFQPNSSLDVSFEISSLENAPTYQTASNCVATLENAVRYINLYCAKLPSDGFTKLVPRIAVQTLRHTDDVSYCTTIRFPINSPLRKPVTGSAMPNLFSSLGAAAVEAVKQLHLIGELNDRFEPLQKDNNDEDLNDDAEDDDLNLDDNSDKRIGSTKRKQYYDKRVPLELIMGPVSVNSPCCLYNIHMKLSFILPANKNAKGRKPIDPEKARFNFGFVCSKPLPHVPDFPIYTRSGEEIVSLELLSSDFLIGSEQHLSILHKFHQYVFAEVLRLERDTLVYKPTETSLPFTLLALNAPPALTVAYEFMEDLLSKPTVRPESLFVPKHCLGMKIRELPAEPFAFKRSLYEDAVIVPNYRSADKPQLFYVAQIRDDLNPQSPFPSPELFNTFEEYYSKKYSLLVSNPSQPLLDADHTASRLSLITPRFVTHKGCLLPPASDKNQTAKRESLRQRQILVPEFCVLHPFPANLWHKAITLPSIFYRCTSLITAGELRKRISKEAAIGKVDYPPDYRPEMLSFGFDLSILCELPQIETSTVRSSTTAVSRDVKPFSDDTVNDWVPPPGYENGNESNSDTDSSASGSENDSKRRKIPEVTVGLKSKTHHSRRADSNSLLETLWRTSSRQRTGDPRQPVEYNVDFEYSAYTEESPFYGPSPCVILQTLITANACDFLNLERLEMIGDSFLKFAVTVYLYCSNPNAHEGRLSYLRSKQVSNFNLYRIGRLKGLEQCIITSKFEPRENWIPPNYTLKSSIPQSVIKNASTVDCDLPYCLMTQQSMSDKTIADCVEALIGCYLTECGQISAVQLMKWLDLSVAFFPNDKVSSTAQHLTLPEPPVSDKHVVHELFDKYNLADVETVLNYNFKNKAYLIQALTHPSYYFMPEEAGIECYQRLEFLGDAVLDYVITRYVFEDPRKHSPGILTDLRSALVNNNIFAALAVVLGFQRHFLTAVPHLINIIDNFVSKFEDSLKSGTFDWQQLESEEHLEIPKTLGDIFESIAGAIYLDSGLSLDVVWSVFKPVMRPLIDEFSANIPISPVRELLELEPESVKFMPPERTPNGRIHVVVKVAGYGQFDGMARNYRLAKNIAARKALRGISAAETITETLNKK